MAIRDSVADLLTIPRGRDPDPALEQRDIHEIDELLADKSYIDAVLSSRMVGDAIPRQPKRVRTIKHMGTIWDYRSFTRPNGGTIRPLARVEHIPVIRQMDGRADLDVLWQVLVNQGLMVHNGTDGEGNVAIYANRDRLCFHARGGNSVTCGTEHMHLTTAENWSNRQLNASAWISAGDWEHREIPHRRGLLGSGRGFVTVRRRGHVTHESVSANAGFHDRSDPGDKYEALMDEIRERAIFFRRHNRF